MSGPKVTSRAEGPVVVVASGGEASRAAVAIRRALEMAGLPPGSAIVRELRDLYGALTLAEQQRARGEGFADERRCQCPSPDSLLTPAAVAKVVGVTPKTVRERCRRGQIPGARQVDGRWLIPTEVLTEESR